MARIAGVIDPGNVPGPMIRSARTVFGEGVEQGVGLSVDGQGLAASGGGGEVDRALEPGGGRAEAELAAVIGGKAHRPRVGDGDQLGDAEVVIGIQDQGVGRRHGDGRRHRQVARRRPHGESAAQGRRLIDGESVGARGDDPDRAGRDARLGPGERRRDVAIGEGEQGPAGGDGLRTGLEIKAGEVGAGQAGLLGVGQAAGTRRPC